MYRFQGHTKMSKFLILTMFCRKWWTADFNKVQTKQMFVLKLTNFSGWQKFAVSQNAKECETLTSSIFTLVMNMINCQKENCNCSWFSKSFLLIKSIKSKTLLPYVILDVFSFIISNVHHLSYTWRKLLRQR